MSELPTFEDLCREAFRLVGDAEDWLRSDWRPGSDPTDRQAAAARAAQWHLAQAKAALDKAAR